MSWNKWEGPAPREGARLCRESTRSGARGQRCRPCVSEAIVREPRSERTADNVDATEGSPWTRAVPAQAPAVDWRRKMRRAIFPLQPCPSTDHEHARRALCTGAASAPDNAAMPHDRAAKGEAGNCLLRQKRGGIRHAPKGLGATSPFLSSPRCRALRTQRARGRPRHQARPPQRRSARSSRPMAGQSNRLICSRR